MQYSSTRAVLEYSITGENRKNSLASGGYASRPLLSPAAGGFTPRPPVVPRSGLGKIDCNRYSIAIFFTFCSSNALEPLHFLNEYRIWPCLYFIFSAQFDIPYSILFVQVTLSHISKFKIIVGMSFPCFCR